jgi:threonine aldolase
MTGMIDIRSDTVTHPTAEMREAMASAEVGDDVYGDDPTVRRLEELGAEMLGKEASLFVPSGTFGNQLALFTWSPRGSEAVLGDECHIIQHEAGAAAVIAGIQTRTIHAPDGILPDLRAHLRRRELHEPATSLLCLENAHSLGKAVPLSAMDEAFNIAREWQVPVHLDGARIFNAAAALNISAKEIAARADSVMFCLSKGLCAPVGSLLAGPKSFVEEARYKRKIMGGGMRQAGILAAAGIIALEKMTGRIGEDHIRARKLAEGLRQIKGNEVQTPQINMVFFRPEKDAALAAECFAREGILINPPDHTGFRFVTHYGIGDREVAKILDASGRIFQ